MSTATVFEAKTHLSSLVHQVERDGEPVIITRHGKPVAKLVPYRDDDAVSRRALALAALRRSTAAAGIRYDAGQALDPLPAGDWGDLGGDPTPPRRVADAP